MSAGSHKQVPTKPTPPQPAPDEEEVRERGDYDSWYSALISFLFHFFLVLLAPLFVKAMGPRETLPPAVASVAVVDSDSDASAGDAGDGLPSSDLPEMSQDQQTPDMAAEVPKEAITAVTDIPLEEVDLTDATAKQAIQESRQDAAEQVKRARSAASAARDRLNQNLGGKPGTGTGTGTSGGGGTGTGRAGRAARWVLKFNTANPRDYLAQLGGLGADVAFPQRGDDYRYFTDVGGSPKSSVRKIDQESRIYWIDENPQACAGVAQELGIPAPPVMLAFLPESLEAKMLKMELAFKGAESEDDIVQTIFECTRRGGGYDVIVVDQTLKGR